MINKLKKLGFKRDDVDIFIWGTRPTFDKDCPIEILYRSSKDYQVFVFGFEVKGVVPIEYIERLVNSLKDYNDN